MRPPLPSCALLCALLSATSSAAAQPDYRRGDVLVSLGAGPAVANGSCNVCDSQAWPTAALDIGIAAQYNLVFWIDVSHAQWSTERGNCLGSGCSDMVRAAFRYSSAMIVFQFHPREDKPFYLRGGAGRAFRRAEYSAEVDNNRVNAPIGRRESAAIKVGAGAERLVSRHWSLSMQLDVAAAAGGTLSTGDATLGSTLAMFGVYLTRR